jgi:hypothetical protein
MYQGCGVTVTDRAVNIEPIAGARAKQMMTQHSATFPNRISRAAPYALRCAVGQIDATASKPRSGHIGECVRPRRDPSWMDAEQPHESKEAQRCSILIGPNLMFKGSQVAVTSERTIAIGRGCTVHELYCRSHPPKRICIGFEEAVASVARHGEQPAVWLTR